MFKFFTAESISKHTGQSWEGISDSEIEYIMDLTAFNVINAFNKFKEGLLMESIIHWSFDEMSLDDHLIREILVKQGMIFDSWMIEGCDWLRVYILCKPETRDLIRKTPPFVPFTKRSEAEKEKGSCSG